MSSKNKQIKTRNWHAVNAWFRKAGAEKDKKKELNKKNCRINKSNKGDNNE